MNVPSKSMLRLRMWASAICDGGAALVDVRRLSAALLLATSTSASAMSPIAVTPGEYDLTTQTVLPHLEEALRYATTRTRRCLHELDATSVFPLLQHQAFSGCILVRRPEAHDTALFELRCANPEAATGTAIFEVDASRVVAVLDVKMGGKNMTLSQRLDGARIGPCSQSSEK